MFYLFVNMCVKQKRTGVYIYKKFFIKCVKSACPVYNGLIKRIGYDYVNPCNTFY